MPKTFVNKLTGFPCSTRYYDGGVFGPIDSYQEIGSDYVIKADFDFDCGTGYFAEYCSEGIRLILVKHYEYPEKALAALSKELEKVGVIWAIDSALRF